MKKKLACVLSAALAVGALAGCAIQNTGKPDDKVDVNQNEGAEIQLVVEGHSDAKEEQLVQTWANKFMEANKNVNIKVNPRGGIVSMDNLVTFEQEGNLPDICWTAGDQHSKWSGSGYFQDLSDETKFPGSAEFFNGMYQSVVDSTHYNNDDTGIWFAPRDYNRLVCFVNKTAFEKCGVEVPTDEWTFTDLETVCRQLLAGNGTYSCKRALELRNWAPVYSTMMKNFGASYVNDEGYCNIGYKIGQPDCPGAKVWKWYEDAIDEETGYAILTNEGATFRGFSPNTRSCNAAIVVDTYANLGKYMDAANKNKYDIDVLAFPSFTDADNGKGYTGAGCSGYAITKGCTDEGKREWAWKFLKYCLSEQGYNDVASLGVVCPSMTAMADKGAWTQLKNYGGETINYRAFVAKNTEDMDLNYQNVLADTDKQAELIGYADTFWKNLGTSTFAGAEEQFRKFYESTIAKA